MAAASKTVALRTAAVLFCLAWLTVLGPGKAASQELPPDVETARNIASVLIAARLVISDLQPQINDPAVGDKKINAKYVVALTKKQFHEITGLDLDKLSKDRRVGLLYQAMLASIGFAVSDREQDIDKAGLGFKGFVPSNFSRAAAVHFNGMAGGAMRIKLIAPERTRRTENAKPDNWEQNALTKRLLAPNWQHGRPYFTSTAGSDGRRLRVLVPEYFKASCLACHGGGKGKLDVSGHPMEGAKVGDLAAAVSLSSAR